MGTLQPPAGGLPEQPPTTEHSFKEALGSQSTPAHDTLFQAIDVDPSNQTQVRRHKGAPAISFQRKNVNRLSESFQWALDGKFSYVYDRVNLKQGRPPVEVFQLYFEAFDFFSEFKIDLLDNRHLLIHFKIKSDFLRLYSRPAWYIRGHSMRILKWDPNFHVVRESSLVPIWVSFLHLPIHFFDKSALFAIASLVGCPFHMDSATASLKRPSMARVQIKIDLLNEQPQRVWIDAEGTDGFWQKMDYENVPPYWKHCWHVDHLESLCHVNNPELRSDVNRQAKGPTARQHYVVKSHPLNAFSKTHDFNFNSAEDVSHYPEGEQGTTVNLMAATSNLVILQSEPKVNLVTPVVSVISPNAEPSKFGLSHLPVIFCSDEINEDIEKILSDSPPSHPTTAITGTHQMTDCPSVSDMHNTEQLRSGIEEEASPSTLKVAPSSSPAPSQTGLKMSLSLAHIRMLCSLFLDQWLALPTLKTHNLLGQRLPDQIWLSHNMV